MTRKILIVDDDAGFLGWLKFGLEEKERFEVHTAETMSEGWRLLREARRDIVIVDIKLPDGDGFELCRKIKEYDQRIPVILVTGVFKEYESWQKGVKVGVNDLLIKPFSYEQLLSRIEEQLRNRQI